MPIFSAPDGTRLAYHVSGDGPPLICLPGGPMHASAYLGDLGGLSAHRSLIRLDLRGTGESQTPADPATYRCDRLVADVEALRTHLDLDEVDLLGHSAGANLALLYTAAHPHRVARLALITPSVFAAGIDIPTEVRLSTARLRSGEPWFAEAYAALEAINQGRPTPEVWQAVAPFSHGRWDEAARAFHAAGAERGNQQAAAVYASEGAFAPEELRTSLAALPAPVLVLAGAVDVGAPPRAMTEYTALFPNAELVVQPGAGHYPWLDDGEGFVALAGGFLSRVSSP
ncbi:alpha/beta hydrolase [Streptomyces sp. NPDC050619]|uniref:alpha/beta fold hydrolase n=1 Tax=Streptomyces sp. NPDC050619 TaxID=3157214 RepID=UPI003423E8D4